MFEIVRAVFPDDLEDVLDLYREYVGSTSVDLSFQGNEQEFSQLPEKYGSEESKIFLLKKDGKPVGCAAYRKLNEEVCEMKRVYVRPSARGDNQGANLVGRVLQEAVMSGYKKICLDVLPEFKAALKLYRSYGFVEHPPVTNNPVPGTHFLGLNLGSV
ncbi:MULTISPECIES: GNAT family N-acetyltransferase [unclassified Modicisalibacter]|uniref:GNAT family N-acetyltransferase n=1 Tax=unclassified Modicisalibacter TaxID=2679913 RepID=UPI001CCDAD42|nr:MULTISPECIES: GNAT family N-acetyltransferase [unclassified Modicisalibacter]MBZ9556789.1 GNAT family N-acetyltransferase [Modicisalibacter sp. R2A 31.J]MBZ9574740.1 GNAT family N-acetyltransferase [Modicisalibacter sp. MOD 31.J]